MALKKRNSASDSRKRKPYVVKKKNTGNKKNKKAEKRSVPRTILRVLLLAILFVAVFMFFYIIRFTHGEVAINLDDYKTNQAQTSIIYAHGDKKGEYTKIGELHGEQNRIWVDLDKIPDNMQNAFTCMEDKRFYDHKGVDWIRTIAVVVKYHGKQGGSTLTQQLIKNLTEENQVTISRKFREILYALNLERHYSKQEILEAYLNTIPLGSGCYGVQTAAEKYFGKDISELDAAECACIASITKAPTYYNPLLNPQNTLKRQKVCLAAMRDQGKLSEKEYEKAVNEKVIFTNSSDYKGSKKVNKTANNEKVNSYYVDYVVDTVIHDLMSKYKLSKSEATKKVYNGGLRIYSCENPRVQEAAEEVFVNRITFPSEPSRTENGEKNTKKKVQSSMTIMDYEGNVVAVVGGAGPKTINRGVNRATDTTRSPGSSIKPLSIYAPAIEEGVVTYGSFVEDYAMDVNGKKWPQNFGGSIGSPGKMVPLQYAVAQSLNTTAARVGMKVGNTVSMKYLTDNFHFTTLVKDGPHTDCNMSSMAVGGMSKGVTNLEMTAAFATFGNEGKYYAPRCYTKVTDYKGKEEILKTKSRAEQALTPATATIMNRLLQTVMTEGTAQGLGVPGFPCFGKTGTTSDTKDKWFCGGNPYFVGTVWYGYDVQEEITQNVYPNPAGRIWQAVMTRALKGYKRKDFTYSDNVVAKAYCKKTGLLAGEGCPSATGYFDSKHLPKTCDGKHASEDGEEKKEEKTEENGEQSNDGDNGTGNENSSSETTETPKETAQTAD